MSELAVGLCVGFWASTHVWTALEARWPAPEPLLVAFEAFWGPR